MADKILVATETFFYNGGGFPAVVRKGDRFREGHDVPTKFPDFFKEDTSVNELKRPVGRPPKVKDPE